MLKKHYRTALIMLAGAILLVGVILLVARVSVNEYIDNSNQITLQHALSKVEDKIKETQYMTFQMAESFYITPLRNTNDIFERNAYYRVLELMKWLPSYGAYNNFIAMNNIVFTSSDYVILPGTAQDLVSFAGNFSFEENGKRLSRDEFVDQLYKNCKRFMPRMRYTTNADNYEEVIPYVIYRENQTAQNMIAAITFIDASMLDEILAQLITSEMGAICIVDEEGRIVSSSRVLTTDEKQFIKSGNETGDIKGYWAETYSAQWRCVLLSYGDEASIALSGFRVLLTVIAIAAVVLVIATAVSVTVHNRKKLSPLVDQLGIHTPNAQNVYAEINRQLQKIMNDKQLLNARLSEQEVVLNTLAVNDLLSGKLPEERSFIGEDHPLIREEYCGVTLIAIKMIGTKNQNELKRIKMLVKEALRAYSSDFVTCDTSTSEIAMIISSPTPMDDDALNERVCRIPEALMQTEMSETPFDVHLYVGTVHVGDGAISRSFAEARMALLNSSIKDEREKITRFSGTETAVEGYYYPQEVEMQLVNMVRSGDTLGMTEWINDLWEKNITRQAAYYDMTIAFLFDFYGTILKIQPSDDELKAMRLKMFSFFKDNAANIGTIEVQQAFINYLNYLTAGFSKSQKNYQHRLGDDMMAYVEEHIGDNNMSLTMMAEAFHFSSGYCSMFFKEQTGMTFSEYLLRLRNEKAHKMLEEGNMSVSEIAQVVGYSSSTAFSRAFKKYYGVNPLQVRERE